MFFYLYPTRFVVFYVLVLIINFSELGDSYTVLTNFHTVYTSRCTGIIKYYVKKIKAAMDKKLQ
jgi:hypothetical protein